MPTTYEDGDKHRCISAARTEPVDNFCGICRDDSGLLVRLSCTHIFCKGCLERLTSTSCPVCRQATVRDSCATALQTGALECIRQPTDYDSDTNSVTETGLCDHDWSACPHCLYLHMKPGRWERDVRRPHITCKSCASSVCLHCAGFAVGHRGPDNLVYYGGRVSGKEEGTDCGLVCTDCFLGDLCRSPKTPFLALENWFRTLRLSLLQSTVHEAISTRALVYIEYVTRPGLTLSTDEERLFIRRVILGTVIRDFSLRTTLRSEFALTALHARSSFKRSVRMFGEFGEGRKIALNRAWKAERLFVIRLELSVRRSAAFARYALRQCPGGEQFVEAMHHAMVTGTGPFRRGHTAYQRDMIDVRAPLDGGD